jgi:hypothetical protein
MSRRVPGSGLGITGWSPEVLAVAPSDPNPDPDEDDDPGTLQATTPITIPRIKTIDLQWYLVIDIPPPRDSFGSFPIMVHHVSPKEPCQQKSRENGCNFCIFLCFFQRRLQG